MRSVIFEITIIMILKSKENEFNLFERAERLKRLKISEPIYYRNKLAGLSYFVNKSTTVDLLFLPNLSF